MLNIILIGAAAALAGAVLGAVMGAWFADRKLRKHYQEVRGEIVRLRSVAEQKLSGDDPKLDDLLENLHSAANKAYAAIQAMENQAAITRRKSDAGKEVITSSRHIIRMIDEYTGEEPEPYVIERKKKPAPKVSAPAGKTDGKADKDEPVDLGSLQKDEPVHHKGEEPVQKALAKRKAAETPGE